MLEMFYKEILPAVSKYNADLTKAVLDKRAAGVVSGFETELANSLSRLGAEMYTAAVHLKVALGKANTIAASEAKANFYHDIVLAAMEELRRACDKAEELTGGQYLPYPTYGELLFGVNE